jgi:hypothetical protein
MELCVVHTFEVAVLKEQCGVRVLQPIQHNLLHLQPPFVTG